MHVAWQMKIRKLHILLAVLVFLACAIPFRTQLQCPIVAVIQMMKGKKTIRDRVAQYGDAAHARLKPYFAAAGITCPPREITLIGLKAEQVLEVWVADDEGQWRHLRDYPIVGISGVLGPKLKEGDRQVPEGLYRLESLNPNSLYHLALRVNYPNADDRKRGEQDGRMNLGSDIMIHGKACSIGCLAMGDEAAEDLFVLAAETGIEHVSIILSPVDFRICDVPRQRPPHQPWVTDLYGTIKKELKTLEKPTTGYCK